MTDAHAIDATTPARRDRWYLWTLLIWIAIAAALITWRWGVIHWFALGDTDDNMRMMQVRALLEGQGWYDLRQYRLSPPQGFDMHWSRLVDLPLAAIILALKPFVGTVAAEKAAIAAGPLLPLAVVLLALGAAVRRLAGRWAWIFVPLVLAGAGSLLGMFAPARIDHHGWQLAMLALLVAGLADAEPRRGGLLAGAATAMSLVIGFEMMPFLALGGAAITLRWIWDGGQAPRLSGYGGALALTTAIGFALFVSRDNLAPRCDALTPPWLVAMTAGGLLLALIARINPGSRLARLGGAAAAGLAFAAIFALHSPQCIGRPEGVSPQLQKEWLDNIREARPIQVQDWRTIVAVLTLPLVSLFAAALMVWTSRRDADRLARWLSLTLLSAAAFALLFFQIRVGAPAQLLAIPASASAAWLIAPRLRASSSVFVRVVGVALVVLVASGQLVQAIADQIPKAADKPGLVAVRRAGARCPTIPSMAPLNRLPPATILTMVDLGPRLITLTHHSALAGPYHRNERQILDVHAAFEGDEQGARRIAARYGASYVMICPKFAETTLYRAQAPKGFYAQLEDGRVPAWLEPVALPAGSPLRLWRVRSGRP